jgi:hypothetical protein
VDDLLIGDLTAPRWSVNSSGRIQIESKDDIRKRLGRSTDSGDAVVQAFFDQARTQGTGFQEFYDALAIFGSAAAIPKGYFDGEPAAPELEDVAECADPDCPNEFSPVAGTTLEQCVKCKLWTEVENG